MLIFQDGAPFSSSFNVTAPSPTPVTFVSLAAANPRPANKEVSATDTSLVITVGNIKCNAAGNIVSRPPNEVFHDLIAILLDFGFMKVILF